MAEAALNNTFQFVLHGEGIDPTAFRARDLSKIMQNLEDLLKDIVESNENAIYDKDALYISLVGVSNSSNGLHFFKSISALLTPALLTLNTAIQNNKYELLPYHSLDNLRNVQSVVKRYNCKGTFYSNEVELGTLTPQTKIDISEDFCIKGQTTIYGYVQRVGGKEPRARMILDSGQPISICLGRQLAKKVANNLYEYVGFNGSATWNKTDFSLLEFKAESIITLEKANNKESFNKLSSIIGKYWDEIDDIEEYLLKK